MKEVLRDMYFQHPAYFNVWNYLYLISDQYGKIRFTSAELCSRFTCSKSTVHRALKHIDKINEEKVYIELHKKNKSYHAKFYVNGKRLKKTERQKFIDRIYDFMKKWYEDNGILYPDIQSHKTHIDPFIKKLEASILKQGKEIDPDTVMNTLEVFMDKIPEWWKDNGCSIPTLKTKFTTIVSQIRKKHGKQNKQSKFDDAQQSYGNIDFTK